MSYQLLRIGKAWRIAKDYGFDPGQVQCMTYRGGSGSHFFKLYDVNYVAYYINTNAKTITKASAQLYGPWYGKYDRRNPTITRKS